MAKKKKDTIEYRYYDVPQNEYVLALFGESWIREYGHDVHGLHFHNLMEMGFCYEGTGEMCIDGQVMKYKEGSFSVIPKNMPHTTISGIGRKSGWEYLFLDPNELLKELYPKDDVYRTNLLNQINRQFVFITQEENEQLIVLMRMLVQEARERKKHFRSMTRALAEALILAVYRQNYLEQSREVEEHSDAGMMQIRNALEYINQSYMDLIRIEDLASVCGLSETHFRRIFKELINMTPSDYLNLVRIQHACEFMRTTNMAMDEVSSHVGFENPTSFTRNFKKFLNMTPYQWKKHPENYAGKILDYKVSALKGW